MKSKPGRRPVCQNPFNPWAGVIKRECGISKIRQEASLRGFTEITPAVARRDFPWLCAKKGR